MRASARQLESLLLLVVPATVLVVWWAVLAAKGPYWLAWNLDPDYPYLLNALNIAQGRAPVHADHPGTAVQLLVAAVIRGAHLLVGRGTVEDDVLSRPESYLTIANWVLLLLYAAALTALGFCTRKATGSAAAGVVVELTPLLSTTAVGHALCVKPEPLLLAISAAMGATVMAGMSGEARRRSATAAATLGALFGMALASKITALPLLALPMVVLVGWRSRAVFAAAAALTGVMLVLPAWRALAGSFAFFTRIATHSGTYGGGGESLFEPGVYFTNIQLLLLQQPALVVALLLGVAACIRAGLPPGEAERTSAFRRALLGLLAAEVGSVLFVARHPGPHYLLPALGLVGVSLALSVMLLEPRLRRAGPMFVAAGVAAILGAGALQAREVLTLRRTLAADQVKQLAISAEVERRSEHARVVYYYRASAPAYALHFGNAFSGQYRSQELRRLFPRAFYYNLWTKRLDDDGPPYRDSPEGAVTLLQGMPLPRAETAELEHALTRRPIPIITNELETVYRLE